MTKTTAKSQKIKPWEELTISDDYMFKAVMSRKRLCKKLIERILQIPVRDIRYMEEEKVIKADYAGKGIRLDVYVADEKNTVYNIEMQMRKPTGDGLYKRTRYYQSMIDADLLKIGRDYDELNPTIIVFICPFAVFDEKRHKYTFRNRCDEDTNLELGDGAVKVFLSTEGEIDDIDPKIKAFLNYVKGKMSNDAFVQEIDQEIHKIKQITRERVKYMTYELKIQEERKYAFKEGLAEGEVRGEIKGKAKMVLGLLKKNMPLSDIADVSEWSVEQIKELAEKNNIRLV